LVVELNCLGTHQCNRFTPKPAIAHFFYRQAIAKSRSKLKKGFGGSLRNRMVNIEMQVMRAESSLEAQDINCCHFISGDIH